MQLLHSAWLIICPRSFSFNHTHKLRKTLSMFSIFCFSSSFLCFSFIYSPFRQRYTAITTPIIPRPNQTTFEWAEIYVHNPSCPPTSAFTIETMLKISNIRLSNSKIPGILFDRTNCLARDRQPFFKFNSTFSLLLCQVHISELLCNNYEQ